MTELRRDWAQALAFSLPFAAALLVWAWWGRLWTDEGWDYLGAHMNSLGHAPYLDYFSHRLPLWEDVYGLVFRAFGDGLQVARFASVAFGTMSVVVLAFVLLRVTGRWYHAAIGLGLLWNMEFFRALSTATVYALPSLCFALSCLCLLRVNRRPLASASLFMFLQGCIWAMRYAVDVQLVVVALFLFLSIWKLDSNPWSRLAVMVSALVPVAWALRTWLFVGDVAVWRDTVTFNFGQLGMMLSALPESLRSSFSRFAYLREIELKAFLPALAIGVGSTIWAVARLRRLVRGWLKVPADSVAVYATVFCTGYYAFFAISTMDWPVTKIYLLPALSIVAAMATKLLLDEVRGPVRAAIVGSWLIILGAWPLVQGTAQLSRHQSARQVLATYEAALGPVLNPGANIFSFNLFLAQFRYRLDPSAGMEVFSLVHRFDDRTAEKLHLLTPDLVVSRVRARSYEALILEEDRFFKDNGDMSRLLVPWRQSLMDAVNEQYDLRTEFSTTFRGKVFVYVPKD